MHSTSSCLSNTYQTHTKTHTNRSVTFFISRSIPIHIHVHEHVVYAPIAKHDMYDAIGKLLRIIIMVQMMRNVCTGNEDRSAVRYMRSAFLSGLNSRTLLSTPRYAFMPSNNCNETNKTLFYSEIVTGCTSMLRRNNYNF